jgi:hypothetical protein
LRAFCSSGLPFRRQTSDCLHCGGLIVKRHQGPETSVAS